MPTFSIEPKVPAVLAASPPPQALMPTLMSDMPMSVTTMPLTKGVTTRRAYLSIRLTNISTTEPATVAPNTAGSPPAKPAAIMGPMNEKLVPCMQSRPQPTGPMRRH